MSVEDEISVDRLLADRFVLGDCVAEGVETQIFNAIERSPNGLGREVAVRIHSRIKPLHDRSEQRFNALSIAMSALSDHPSGVQLLASGIDLQRGAFFAMEWLGGNLQQRLAVGAADPIVVKQFLTEIGQALSALHSQRDASSGCPLLHTDLKPTSILFKTINATFKLAGLGSVRYQDDLQSFKNIDRRYAAPEIQSESPGAISPATDLYALGCIAYELALGTRRYQREFPFIYSNLIPAESTSSRSPVLPDEQDRWRSWHQNSQLVAKPLSQVIAGFPEELSRIIEKLTAKKPQDRHQSAYEMLAELSRPQVWMPPAEVPRLQMSHTAAALMATVILLITVGAFSLGRSNLRFLSAWTLSTQPATMPTVRADKDGKQLEVKRTEDQQFMVRGAANVHDLQTRVNDLQTQLKDALASFAFQKAASDRSARDSHLQIIDLNSQIKVANEKLEIQTDAAQTANAKLQAKIDQLQKDLDAQQSAPPANKNEDSSTLLQAAIRKAKAGGAEGIANEMNDLGMFYDKGLIGDNGEDPETAISWFRKSADKGCVRAMSNMGVMYELGRGVTKDLNMAASWYQKAADLGDSYAKNRLNAIKATPP